MAEESRIGLYMQSYDIWHHVIDEVLAKDERRLLSACRRWNSEWWVTRDGREFVETPDRGRSAAHCEDLNEAGSWTACRTPAEGPQTGLYFRRNEVWHLAFTASAEVTTEHGTVYMTTCGRWLNDVDVAIREAKKRRPVPICALCAQGGEEQAGSATAPASVD